MLQPFKGVKVLDLTEGVAGPYAAMLLGESGAEVIKIERPAGDWGRILGSVANGFSSQYIALNRSKKNICLNIQSEEGQEIFKKIAMQSDIIITSFRPGITEKYSIGYEDIKKINPDIIYGRISAYGYYGKLKSFTGVDTVIQANSGIMNHIGPADGLPYRTGFPIIDHVAARDLVQGIQALYIQKLKGEAITSPLDVSLYATAAALQAQQWQDYFLNRKVPRRSGNFNPVIAPSAVYETQDGLYISIAAVRNEQWHRLCQAIDREDFIEDKRFASNELRLENRNSMEEIIIQQMKTKTSAQWIQLFQHYDITYAPVLNMEQIYHSDYFDSIPTVDFQLDGKKVQAIGLPFVYGGDLHKENAAAPARKGQQTIEILKSINMSDEEIASLLEKEIIKTVREVHQ